MTTAQVWFGIFLGLALVALTAIVGVGVYWQSVGRKVSEWWARLAAKLIQLPALIVSGYATYVAARGTAEAATEVTKRTEWLPVAVTGAVCIVLWEIASLLIDSRVKAAEKADKKMLEAVELECERRTELLTAFREAVADKVRRLMRAIRQRKAKPSPALLRRYLDPETHLVELLQSLAVSFEMQLPEDQAGIRHFRVGLYIRSGEAMTPLHAVNLRNPSYNVFTSFERHAAAFRLDATEHRSHVVNCVRQKRMIVVEDCVAAEKEGGFVFFNDDQRSYLRSMVAYHLAEVCLSDGTMTEAALVIDTDVSGFFRESESDWLEFCLHEFGTRVKLELLLRALLEERS